jgi:hypothetical protein
MMTSKMRLQGNRYFHDFELVALGIHNEIPVSIFSAVLMESLSDHQTLF